ncbi:hypothetical protein BHM03_00029244 [Ensete ventricosum]|uniref:Uncharacterized protein n=1 Tax=Ensete ventricosum TaxID=4639 RepID=A0A445MHZ3_ENSVE|nr:hypothetical protein BHM03_00029244 [Ensete ventricosum]
MSFRDLALWRLRLKRGLPVRGYRRLCLLERHRGSQLVSCRMYELLRWPYHYSLHKGREWLISELARGRLGTKLGFGQMGRAPGSGLGGRLLVVELRGLYNNSNGVSVPESLIFFIAYHTAASHHVVRGPCGEARACSRGMSTLPTLLVLGRSYDC